VIRGQRPAHTLVRDRQGRGYDLRIKPYRTPDNRIDGAVMTLAERVTT
jgi:two-component system CheB/CheR fusion protein